MGNTKYIYNIQAQAIVQFDARDDERLDGIMKLKLHCMGHLVPKRVHWKSCFPDRTLEY